MVISFIRMRLAIHLVKLAGIICVLLITLSSCSPVIKLLYGIHNPRLVSSEKILNKAEKYGIAQSQKMYAFSYEGFQAYTKDDNSINGLFIYKNGSRVLPKDSSTCSGSLINLAKNFKDKSAVELIAIDSTKYYGSYLLDLETGTPVQVETDKEYVAYVFWATYAGRLNRTLSAEWIKELQKNDDLLIVIVSLDQRSFWRDT